MKRLIYKLKIALDNLLDNLYCYIWDPILSKWHSMIWIFRNLKTFWIDIKRFRTYDYAYSVDIFCTAIEALKNDIEKRSLEVNPNKQLKIEAMEELLCLLSSHDYNSDDFDNDYINYKSKIDKIWSDSSLSKEEKNKASEEVTKNYILSEDKKSTAKTDYIFRILRGQDYDKNEPFDGTGITNWWY